MRFAQQGGQHVAGLQVKIVVGPVQVGRHDAAIVPAVLALKRLAQLDPGDFGHRVGLVGQFQRPGQQGLLPHGLGGVTRVDARRAQKKQPVDARFMRAMYHIAGHQQVLVDEIRRKAVIGLDTAHLGGGQVHLVYMLIAQELLHLILTHQIHLGAAAGDDAHALFPPQAAHQRRTHHAPVTCYENSCLVIQPPAPVR